MHLHEYQAKEVFSHYGIPVPRGVRVESGEAVAEAIETLGGGAWVAKAQVHAGGRGKAGGVRRAVGGKALRETVESLLGSRLVTGQTGPEGLPVASVLIESLTDIQRELYLSLLVDRGHRRVAVVASSAGGIDIESVAAETPDLILTAHAHPVAGLQAWQGRQLGFALGLDAPQVAQFSVLLSRLYRLFTDIDAALIEINPLVVTGGGDLIALDAKINLDDNALYRQQRLAEREDETQTDPAEAFARGHGLNYIRLDGDIGCMVNGAGLAMATMDLIKLSGGRPANFLDVGGAATAERVAEAFKLILSGEHIRAVLVNIFGGIVRCDLIAEGIVQAVREVAVSVPVVVRLEGTNADKGRAILADSGLNILPAEDLADAAARAVAAAGGEA
ncbi:ADP-forming succinate--CoA ligase subunit beta [Acidihalobacter prosperus]|uniref:Succinate--CoA ligase [ADP-forming] subunit beta n=1 Tax=Acidihalobacter prosperus TaxID=160660 RepID=A0A1A6C399_9GAMM|nr:ADP-forming succinate--CoA ligase subunit beta [Acidihalobacter prosperus]OBS09036.1 Succinyl-CoA ligase [ADP-forming] beta chain [Acidihalobacter prosperus]